MASRTRKQPLQGVSPADEVTFRQAYEPYAAEMGHANIAWNRLQENLGNLFGILLRAKDKNVAAAIWYATTNDNMMRDILVAVAKTKLKRRKAMLADVEWLIDRTNEICGDRNTIIHAPLRLTKLLGASFFVIPDYWSGHKRAQKLKHKDLLAEYKSLTARATKLSEFADGLVQHLYMPSIRPWPERPGAPLFPPKQTREEQNRRKHEKLLRTQRQALPRKSRKK